MKLTFKINDGPEVPFVESEGEFVMTIKEDTEPGEMIAFDDGAGNTFKIVKHDG